MKKHDNKIFIGFLLTAVLFLCMGNLYIDTTSNLWRTAGSNVQMIVTGQLGISVNTNNGYVSLGTSNAVVRLDLNGGANLTSNLVFTNITKFLATNSTANTNLTLDLDQPYEVWYLTNNLSITNIVGSPTNRSKSILRFVPAQLVNRTVVYPTFGAPSFGVRIFTNANSQPWGTFTGGVAYAISITFMDTNGLLSVTEWK